MGLPRGCALRTGEYSDVAAAGVRTLFFSLLTLFFYCCRNNTHNNYGEV
jgi:hypothetical protein